MVAEHKRLDNILSLGCSLAKISMVAEPSRQIWSNVYSCSLAKISMVAEL